MTLTLVLFFAATIVDAEMPPPLLDERVEGAGVDDGGFDDGSYTLRRVIALGLIGVIVPASVVPLLYPIVYLSTGLLLVSFIAFAVSAVVAGSGFVALAWPIALFGFVMAAPPFAIHGALLTLVDVLAFVVVLRPPDHVLFLVPFFGVAYWILASTAIPFGATIGVAAGFVLALEYERALDVAGVGERVSGGLLVELGFVAGIVGAALLVHFALPAAATVVYGAYGIPAPQGEE